VFNEIYIREDGEEPDCDMMAFAFPFHGIKGKEPSFILVEIIAKKKIV